MSQDSTIKVVGDDEHSDEFILSGLHIAVKLFDHLIRFIDSWDEMIEELDNLRSRDIDGFQMVKESDILPIFDRMYSRINALLATLKIQVRAPSAATDARTPFPVSFVAFLREDLNGQEIASDVLDICLGYQRNHRHHEMFGTIGHWVNEFNEYLRKETSEYLAKDDTKEQLELPNGQWWHDLSALESHLRSEHSVLGYIFLDARGECGYELVRHNYHQYD